LEDHLILQRLCSKSYSLEFYYNLLGVEVVKQLKFNVLFRYFVGLEVEETLPDNTSLAFSMEFIIALRQR